jgi:hypothetical protein
MGETRVFVKRPSQGSWAGEAQSVLPVPDTGIDEVIATGPQVVGFHNCEASLSQFQWTASLPTVLQPPLPRAA